MVTHSSGFCWLFCSEIPGVPLALLPRAQNKPVFQATNFKTAF